mmetsp:Transcript_18298/g.35843  ORF Transcript_18298/g.35843 Transcript_18298/m.35843 type:complete len:591 (+) Transcript_18298:960-2732(+)
MSCNVLSSGRFAGGRVNSMRRMLCNVLCSSSSSMVGNVLSMSSSSSGVRLGLSATRLEHCSSSLFGSFVGMRHQASMSVRANRGHALFDHGWGARADFTVGENHVGTGAWHLSSRLNAAAEDVLLARLAGFGSSGVATGATERVEMARSAVGRKSRRKRMATRATLLELLAHLFGLLENRLVVSRWLVSGFRRRFLGWVVSGVRGRLGGRALCGGPCSDSRCGLLSGLLSRLHRGFGGRLRLDRPAVFVVVNPVLDVRMQVSMRGTVVVRHVVKLVSAFVVVVVESCSVLLVATQKVIFARGARSRGKSMATRSRNTGVGSNRSERSATRVVLEVFRLHNASTFGRRGVFARKFERNGRGGIHVIDMDCKQDGRSEGHVDVLLTFDSFLHVLHQPMVCSVGQERSHLPCPFRFLFFQMSYRSSQVLVVAAEVLVVNGQDLVANVPVLDGKFELVGTPAIQLSDLRLGDLFSMEVERLVVNEFLHFQVCVSERDVGCVLGWDRLGESSDKDWHGLGRENIETFESVAFKEVDHVCAETRREHVFGLSFAQFAKLALHRRRRFRHIVGEERAVGDQQSSMDVAHNTHEPWNI